MYGADGYVPKAVVAADRASKLYRQLIRCSAQSITHLVSRMLSPKAHKTNRLWN